MGEAVNVAAIGVSFSVNIPGERNLVFQTHMPQTATAGEMNELADRLMLVSDRLVAKYTVPLLEAQFEVESGQLERLKDDLARVDAMHANNAAVHQRSGKKAPFKLEQKDEQQRAQVVATLKAYTDKVGKLSLQLAECRGKVNGSAIAADH